MKNDFGDSSIVYISTYPPRECGIATFTRDLTNAIDKRLPNSIKSQILAMNNNGVNIYNYPKKVSHQISDTEMNDYIEVAKKINKSPEIKLVNIQHEYGIFGGEFGEYLLAFLEVLEKPSIITFHSILPDPDEKMRRVTKAISEKVSEIVVMTEKGVEILRKVYEINTPIRLIPHGIPVFSFDDQKKEKANLGLQDKTILLTHGLVGPGKGYEHAIEALPDIVKKYPNLLYIIVGETHPAVRKNNGEQYRNYLTKKIKRLGLENHVKFYNKYITEAEKERYLKACDIYICSPDNPNQITSGTLAVAMGCGRAIISTPFLHAKDIVSEERGILGEFKNPDSFKKAILHLLKNPSLRKSMEKNAYYYTRHMTWPNVAIQYCKLFRNYMGQDLENLPKIDTSHLKKLTDNFGIVQFAVQTEPDTNSGYTLDDNARALLVCTKHYEKFKEYNQLSMIRIYLDYLKYVQKEGKLYNFVDKHKKLYRDWSEDSQGRAIWALGYLISSPNIPHDFKKDAEEILTKAVSLSESIGEPRAIAFMIQGLSLYNQYKSSSDVKNLINNFASRLVDLFKENSSGSWEWFEPQLTYANSKLSEALLYAYLSTGEREYLEVGLKSLRFLSNETFENNIFIPIGQRGWYVKDKKRAYYDQQPIEASYMVQTLILAHNITKDDVYKDLAFQTFQWFTGKNSLNQVIYNEVTGGCHDGLGENAINLNQGAESTISYLLARLSLMDL